MKSNTIWLDSKSRYAAALIATIISVGLTGGIGIYLSSTPKASTVYYHFNIQYKMGDESTYDEIIMSMTHVMYMYDNHTNWNYTLETQFRTIEYMYENFPASFDLLQKHNQNGQLELIVPQYGHGWHLPYPEKDFRESINYTLARMNEWNLSRSGICVLQEGHWMPGFGSVAESGNFDAFVIHREQLGYFGTYPDRPVLEWDYLGRKSYAMVVPRFPRVEGGYYHCQIYSADGELLNTGIWKSMSAPRNVLHLMRKSRKTTKII